MYAFLRHMLLPEEQSLRVLCGRLATLVVAAFAVGCGPAPDSTAAYATAEAGWTVLMYMMADNDLEGEAARDIDELRSVEPGDALNIVVQADRGTGRRSWADLGKFTSAKRFRIGRQGHLVELDDLGETNSADADTLEDFVAWGVERFPARNTMLVVWDHGTGGYGVGGDEHLAHRTHGVTMSINAMATAVGNGLSRAGGRPFDIIDFDACMMASYETAVSLAPYADYLLAAAEDEPAEGQNWRVLQQLADDPSMSATDLGNAAIDAFFAASAKPSLQLSLIDLDAMGQLTAAVDALAGTLVSSLTGDAAAATARAVNQAATDSLWYHAGDWNENGWKIADLGSWSGNLEGTPFAEPASVLTAAIDEAVIANRRGETRTRSTGLNIVLPPSPSQFHGQRYDAFRFTDTPVASWVGLLDAFHAHSTAAFVSVDHQSMTLEWLDDHTFAISAQSCGDNPPASAQVRWGRAVGGAVAIGPRDNMPPSYLAIRTSPLTVDPPVSGCSRVHGVVELLAVAVEQAGVVDWAYAFDKQSENGLHEKLLFFFADQDGELSTKNDLAQLMVTYTHDEQLAVVEEQWRLDSAVYGPSRNFSPSEQSLVMTASDYFSDGKWQRVRSNYAFDPFEPIELRVVPYDAQGVQLTVRLRVIGEKGDYDEAIFVTEPRG